MKRVTVVMGTRPEAIKLCPLVLELKKRQTLSVSVCASGQHRELLDSALRDFGVTPNDMLDVMRAGQSATTLYAKLLFQMGELLRRRQPELVVVQGDTATACAAAQAAFYNRIPVAHIEAGLRTYHMYSPFPEEYHRRAIALMSALHFAPTEQAAQNLIREGMDEKRIFVTGNTVIDALRYTLGKKGEYRLPQIPKNMRTVLFTAHRREHWGSTMEGMFAALCELVETHTDVMAVCPLHPNPSVRKLAAKMLQGKERILCIEPPSVAAFHRLLSRAYLVLTDSGGIQEEAAALGIPTIVMRYSTERAEGVDTGNLRLSGSGKAGIVEVGNLLLRSGSEAYADMKKPSAVFGDGYASVKIADVLEKIN